MKLIGIIPSTLDPSEDEIDLAIQTRHANVIGFMNKHVKMSPATQAIQVLELAKSVEEITDNLVRIANIVRGFASHCLDYGYCKPGTIQDAEKLIKISTPFADLADKIVDLDDFMCEYYDETIDDLRHEQVSKLYQHFLNLSNYYTLVVRLSNSLSSKLLPVLPDGTVISSLAEKIYNMTEKVRYGLD